MRMFQPACFRFVQASDARAGIDIKIRDANDVGLRTIGEAKVRAHPDPVGRLKFASVQRHDERAHSLRTGFACGDEGKVPPRR